MTQDSHLTYRQGQCCYRCCYCYWCYLLLHPRYYIYHGYCRFEWLAYSFGALRHMRVEIRSLHSLPLLRYHLVSYVCCVCVLLCVCSICVVYVCCVFRMCSMWCYVCNVYLSILICYGAGLQLNKRQDTRDNLSSLLYIIVVSVYNVHQWSRNLLRQIVAAQEAAPSKWAALGSLKMQLHCLGSFQAVQFAPILPRLLFFSPLCILCIVSVWRVLSCEDSVLIVTQCGESVTHSIA